MQSKEIGDCKALPGESVTTQSFVIEIKITLCRLVLKVKRKRKKAQAMTKDKMAVIE